MNGQPWKESAPGAGGNGSVVDTSTAGGGGGELRVFTMQARPDTLDGGWVAECPELPGCLSQGQTRDEALASLADAITSVISLRAEQA